MISLSSPTDLICHTADLSMTLPTFVFWLHQSHTFKISSFHIFLNLHRGNALVPCVEFHSIYWVSWSTLYVACLFPHHIVHSFKCSLMPLMHQTCCQVQFSSVQSLICVQLFATLWTVACQASLSITNSQSLLKLVSIESGMPSNCLILCCPLLLLPSIFSNIRVFSNESVLHIRWPKYWRFICQVLRFIMNNMDTSAFRTYNLIGLEECIWFSRRLSGKEFTC